jgi:PAS domain-containing protein
MPTRPEHPTYTVKHEAILHRLVPAWIKEDFDPVADLLDGWGLPEPCCVWSPEVASMPGERLGAMYALWKDHAGERDLPSVEDCRPEVYGELSSVMMFLDLSEDGRSFRYRHYGEELAAHANMNWTGRTTVDMASFIEHSLLYASSYLASETRREPLYTEVVSSPKLITTTWCRLLLPYVDAKAGVVSFACGNVPMPGLPTWPRVEGRGREARPQAALPERKLAQDFLRMERNLRDILTLTSAAVMIVEPEAGTIYFINEPMISLLGRFFPEVRFMPPDDIFGSLEPYEKALEQTRAGGAVRSLEVQLRAAGGIPRWTLMSAHNVYFDNQPRIAFWFYDITDQKRTEEALLVAQSQKEETIRQLQEALERVRTLEGIIPICSYCKKIRNDQHYWLQVEQYITERTQATFTHGICPDCRDRVLAELPEPQQAP